MACRLRMSGPRLLPGGPTLQPGTPSWPPQRAEPGSPRIAAVGFVCSAENLSPRPRAGIDSGRAGGGERRGSAPRRGKRVETEKAAVTQPGLLPALSPPPLITIRKRDPRLARIWREPVLGGRRAPLPFFQTLPFLYTDSSPVPAPWKN